MTFILNVSLSIGTINIRLNSTDVHIQKQWPALIMVNACIEKTDFALGPARELVIDFFFSCIVKIFHRSMFFDRHFFCVLKRSSFVYINVQNLLTNPPNTHSVCRLINIQYPVNTCKQTEKLQSNTNRNDLLKHGIGRTRRKSIYLLVDSVAWQREAKWINGSCLSIKYMNSGIRRAEDILILLERR